MEYNLYDYDGRYDNDVCKAENKFIKKLLLFITEPDEVVLDIGAGTGLVHNMLENRNYVISTDINPQSAKIIKDGCQSTRVIIETMDATKALNTYFSRDIITCMFALHYLSFKDIWTILNSRSVCAIYNKPYKHPHSIYSGKPLMFYKEHWKKHLFIKLCMILLRIKPIPLTGDCYQILITG